MILVFGSLNADLIFDVAVTPGAGETVLAKGFRIEAGGKGANQAVAAARDGAGVVMVGAVGADALREIALSQLSASGVDVSRVDTTDAATGCASIMVDAEGRNQIAVALGANARAGASQVTDALLARAQWLLLQMESPPDQVEALLKRARAAGVRTILNLAPAVRLEPEAWRLCDLLVLNESEASSVAGWFGCGDDAEALRIALGVDVLRTLGVRGSEASTGAGHVFVPARKVSAVDTTAAGDCYVGVLAAALARGHSITGAMQRASAAAALACMRKGSQVSLPWEAEIDAFAAEAGEEGG